MCDSTKNKDKPKPVLELRVCAIYCLRLLSAHTHMLFKHHCYSVYSLIIYICQPSFIVQMEAKAREREVGGGCDYKEAWWWW